MLKRFIFKTMQKKAITDIIHWKYNEPYSFYNVCKDNSECMLTMVEFMSGYYYSVHDEEDQLVGYACFSEPATISEANQYDMYSDKDTIDIGFALKPQLTGRGLGIHFVKAVIDFFKNRYSFHSFRLTVASFNKRAIRVYERLGFKDIGRFIREKDGVEYIVMKSV
jgi:[ribosomal protein S18]-alanine N-acetyltransferase